MCWTDSTKKRTEEFKLKTNRARTRKVRESKRRITDKWMNRSTESSDRSYHPSHLLCQCVSVSHAHTQTLWHAKGVRDPCCLRYLTRRLINIEMTSGKEVQRFTSGVRQEGGGATAREVKREEDEGKKEKSETVVEGWEEWRDRRRKDE